LSSSLSSFSLPFKNLLTPPQKVLYTLFIHINLLHRILQMFVGLFANFMKKSNVDLCSTIHYPVTETGTKHCFNIHCYCKRNNKNYITEHQLQIMQSCPTLAISPVLSHTEQKHQYNYFIVRLTWINTLYSYNTANCKLLNLCAATHGVPPSRSCQHQMH